MSFGDSEEIQSSRLQFPVRMIISQQVLLLLLGIYIKSTNNIFFRQLYIGNDLKNILWEAIDQFKRDLNGLNTPDNGSTINPDNVVYQSIDTENDLNPISTPMQIVFEKGHKNATFCNPVDNVYRMNQYRAGDAVVKPRLPRVKRKQTLWLPPDLPLFHAHQQCNSHSHCASKKHFHDNCNIDDNNCNSKDGIEINKGTTFKEPTEVCTISKPIFVTKTTISVTCMKSTHPQ